MADEYVTLANIGHGAAEELFSKELKKVIRNIKDPMCSSKAKRSISIKVTIQPDDERNIGFATLDVSSKLAGSSPVSSTMYFGAIKKDDGETLFVAAQTNFVQPSMFDESKSTMRPITALIAETEKS